MNQHSDNGLQNTEDKRKETRSRARKRQIEEEESLKYKRVTAALNAADLSAKYQSQFQRHEMDDDKIQKCIDNPQELDIFLSSIIPIVGHKLSFMLEFKKTKESENDRAEQQQQLEEEHQSSSSQSSSASVSGTAKATPKRIQQPNVYINTNVMKVKMEEDYTPIKKEEPERDMENSEDPAPPPKLKDVQIILTRIESAVPAQKSATVDLSSDDNLPSAVSAPPPASAPASASASASPDSDSDSDSDSTPPYTITTWCVPLDKLQEDKEDVGFRIIQYLAFLHAHKFPVKKDIAFAGWLTDPSKLEAGFRLLEEKYKLIKVKDNVVQLNIKIETADDNDDTDETDQNPWLWLLCHHLTSVLPLLAVNVACCIPLLDEQKMLRSDTEEMFENFLLVAKDSETDREKIFMNDIPRFWFFLFQLALRLLDACRYDDSYPLFKRFTQSREEERGSNCRDVLVAKNNMALILDNQDKPEEALAIYQDILPALQEHFGPDDQGTVSAKYNVGCILKAKRKYEEALGFYRQVYESRKKELGKNHIRTTAVLKIINEILVRMNK